MHNPYKRTYSKEQEIEILSEFKRTKDICYLEHAGATLYSEKQITDILSDLTTKLYANPHSRSTASKITEDSIDQIRYQILNHFNTNLKEYSVVFTNGATGALKLVSETFNYNNGCFAYLQDNHTSVLGMRNNATNVKVLAHNDAFNILNNPSNHANDIRNESSNKNSLFVYPAQCNFAGTKYPLAWINNIQRGALNHVCNSSRWYCLLDAAAYVSTSALDLSFYKPDFVCISFYKIFGYPTGLGALLVRKDSEDVLLKKYYGGGTVFMALSLKNISIPRNVLYERFEDGTASFLSILSLKYGFQTLNRLNLNMDLISSHTFALARYVYYQLLTLHHSNGRPVAILYHDTTFEDRNHQGGVINFNLLRSNGDYIGYSEVLHIANLFSIQLRTGCFCNPGSCQRHLKLSTDDVLDQFEKGHVCGDQNDLINGTPTGSVRISFGYMSMKADADEFLSMIEECYVEKPITRKIPENYDAIKEIYRKKFCSTPNTAKEGKADEKNVIKNDTNPDSKLITKIDSRRMESTADTVTVNGILEDIYIFPVKSCGAFKVEECWDLSPTGLKYDREWMIVNDAGVCITQKTDSELCRIKPVINLLTNNLELHYKDMQKISISLNLEKYHKVKVFPCQSKVCGDPIVGWDCGQEVSDWISKVLNKPGLRLLKQSSNQADVRRKTVKGETVALSLANQAQFLLINKASIQYLQKFLINEESVLTIDDLIGRFRPNFVVDFKKPFIENELLHMEVDKLSFKISGKCTRCQVICIDQNTGQKSADLLQILSKEFKGKISFGMYLKQENFNENDQIALKASVSGKINT